MAGIVDTHNHITKATSAIPIPSSLSPALHPALAEGIAHLKILTGLDFSLKPDAKALVFDGPVPIPIYDRLYHLGQEGAVGATITYPLQEAHTLNQKVEVTEFDLARLQKLSQEEPQRRQKGEQAAEIMTRTTGRIFAFDGFSVFTEAPPLGDKLYTQLSVLHKGGAFPGSKPWDVIPVVAPEGRQLSYISFNDVDVARMRVLASTLQADAAREGGMGR